MKPRLIHIYRSTKYQVLRHKTIGKPPGYSRAAVIAQWICLRLLYCRPGFVSQAKQLCFCDVKRRKVNKMRPLLAHIFKNSIGFAHSFISVHSQCILARPLVLTVACTTGLS